VGQLIYEVFQRLRRARGFLFCCFKKSQKAKFEAKDIIWIQAGNRGKNIEPLFLD
jgi:hypothetical protein